MTDNSNPAADMLESAKADTSRPLIVFLTSEMYPFSKTGGLADVLGALPVALHLAGANVAVVTPFYGRLATAGHEIRLVQSNCPVGYPWPPITAEIYQTDYQGVPVYFVSRPEYFDRRQYYNTYQGDYFDNCERFNFFVRAALAWCSQLDSAPAVIHANDWQTALAPVYLHFMRQADPFWAEAKSVLSIHNLAFQGRFAFRLFEGSGLPPAAWNLDGVEFHGDFNLLKGGIAYADRIVTVSPSYSREILSPRHGQGLEGILAKRRAVVSGILNGADYDVWSPEDNRYLPCSYGWDRPEDKQVCKRALIREMYLADQLENRPILSFIGRLRGQKGIDLLIDILPQLMTKEVGVVVLGEGNLSHEARLLEMMERYPGRLSVQVGYAEDLAHRILAGSDIFLMPSRYEPCGLTQMYALRFGAPPVATAVGGLIDTIISHPSPYSTGFTFARPEPGLFLDAVNKALRLWHDGHAWRQLMVRAMRQSFTWERSAEQYAELYRNLGFEL